VNEPAPTREQLIESIPARIHELMQASSRLGNEPWLDLDLTMKQLKVLLVLDALGPCRPSVIASAIGASPANATGVLDRLESAGYIARQPDPADRRALLVHPTEAAQSMVSSLHTSGQQRLVRALVEMVDVDLAALARGLDALLHVTKRLLPSDLAIARVEGGAQAPRTALDRG
jgi:DNA-binding MarR family transcriptional regulator